MPKENKLAVLAEIATEILVAELARRAAFVGMTTDQLIEAGREKWNEADSTIDRNLQIGHEQNL